MSKYILLLFLYSNFLFAQITNIPGGNSGSGGGSVFTGSTATNPAFSATPTFSLADVSVKSPTRIEPGALTANVTSVTFTNKTAGAKFSIAWTQDGTGGRTISYGASASNTCTIDPTASATTTQFLEVGADGSTVNGVGCKTTSNFVAQGPEMAAPGTPATSTGVAWFDSTNHILSVKENNSATISNTVVPDTGAANNFLTSISAGGVISKARPTCSSLSDSGSGCTGSAASGNAVTSVTPVTVNTNTTSDQQLMELSMSAGYFNSIRQPFLFDGAGVYTTQTAQTPTITLKVKLCTVSGCGSGTVVTLISIVSTATIAAVTNNNWHILLMGYTSTTGATGNLEIHGPLAVDLGALTTTADSVFVDTNTTVSSNINLTAALFVDFTIAFSTNAATANIFTQRSGGVMPFAAIAAPVTSVFTQTGAVGDLTGDVTTSGSTATTIAASAVTSAKLNITTSTCTYPAVLTAISATGVGTCTVPTIPQNSQSAAYTTVLGDAGKHIYHPVGDNNARTFTIDSNANVAYPVGTTITFMNEINTVSIAITADTMVLAGTATTGTRTLAAGGIATALKVTSTRWIINGTGLT